jgi:hypothetical protein
MTHILNRILLVQLVVQVFGLTVLFLPRMIHSEYQIAKFFHFVLLFDQTELFITCLVSWRFLSIEFLDFKSSFVQIYQSAKVLLQNIRES